MYFYLKKYSFLFKKLLYNTKSYVPIRLKTVYYQLFYNYDMTSLYVDKITNFRLLFPNYHFQIVILKWLFANYSF